MSALIKSSPLFLALIASPVWAAPADEHAGHHPPEAAAPAPETDKSAAKADPAPACPMMTEMMRGDMRGGGMAADGNAAQPRSDADMRNRAMHCMTPAQAAENKAPQAPAPRR